MTFPFPVFSPELVANDPFWSSVVFLVPCSGANGGTSFTDVGPNAYTVSPFGNAQTSSAQTLFGANTGLFDASGDYLTVDGSDPAASIANSTDITMEGWIYVSTLDRINTILNKRSGSSAHEFNFAVNSTNKLILSAFRSGSAVAQVDGATTLSASTWYHVAAVRTTGGVWKVYLDGTQDGTATESNTPSATAVNVRIGRDNFNTARDFAGHLAELRFTTVARYTANFTRPTAAFPRS